jgi:epoxyqueuosine reductase
MDYLQRTAGRRADPRQVLPGARTVMTLSLFYGGGGEERSCRSGSEAAQLAASGRGEIARYARGTDYHRVMERRLVDLCRVLRERLPAEGFRYYVDTGPVLEKAWAEAGGLGWIGKNTCAIDPRRGSYFFIGVVITTIELPPDEPAMDHCGSCRLCIDSCPTSALIEPYRLDSRRCISYLTIEHRGAIEPELREAAGGLVFGCDICQEVCPFNRAPEPGADPELAAREENRSPLLGELALLDEAAFAARFPRSAVKRAKAAGLVRNAVHAIGSSGRRDFLPFLEELAGREWIARDPVLCEAIAWARGRLR